METQTVTLSRGVHRGKPVLFIRFTINFSLNNLIRNIHVATWSDTNKCWITPLSEAYVEAVKLVMKDVADVILEDIYVPDILRISNESSEIPNSRFLAVSDSGKEELKQELLKAEVLQDLKRFREWLQSKRYSERTIDTYMGALTVFLRQHTEIAIAEICNEHIIKFNNDYILSRKLSASYQNQMVNAIKLFFKIMHQSKIDPELIHRPRQAKVLPNVLDKGEVKQILEVHQNIKHRTMLALIYSCGLRCGELLQLKPEHILSNRNLLHIKGAKGNKDRVVPLGNKIIQVLRDYYKIYKPKVYLFEGQIKGTPYDARSLQQILKSALLKCGIRKPVTLHWLRHSYATHLLENGTDLRYIQEILGHNSSRTTEIYTHVSNRKIQQIVSPFDDL